MKKLYLFCTLLLVQLINAQDPATEKSIFSGQVGLFGAWINHEARLSNQFTLKTEVGLDVFARQTNDDFSLDALAPVLTLEPRWYYNLEKRGNKGEEHPEQWRELPGPGHQLPSGLVRNHRSGRWPGHSASIGLPAKMGYQKELRKK